MKQRVESRRAKVESRSRTGWGTVLLCSLAFTCSVSAQVPQLINYQGRVTVGTTAFNGTGQFKFALVNSTGSTSFWSNDGSSASGSQPTQAVSLTVANGLYSVLLGDATIANMTVVPGTIFANADVRLRVWFNDGTNGWQQLTPDQRIAAVGYALMAGNVPDGAITSAKLASGAVTAANIASGSITSTQLASGAAAANLNASGQGGVPSGGTVLSSNPADGNLSAAGYVKLGKVDLGDVWEQRTSAFPPSARESCTAVWTGSEMIVWGGANGGAMNDGGRYNPASDVWTPVSTTGAPSAREFHTAVWTGTEMIVWGGDINGSYLGDGGRYNPVADTWVPFFATALAGRHLHTAVWTGSEMIVWGGTNGTLYFNDGGRFNPATGSWAAVPAPIVPGGRAGHTAVWTGSEMVVWGGTAGPVYYSDGGRFNPATGSWTTVPAPITFGITLGGRTGHTVVWTGTEMIVWGGVSNGAVLNDGGRFNPATGSWAAVNASGAPTARTEHTAVWTGTEMIVWGGYNNSIALNDGGRFNPATGSWAAVTTSGGPAARRSHAAVWTGTAMLVWGGNTGGNLLNDTWSYTPVRAMYLYQRP
jgi:hypothetical protein